VAVHIWLCFRCAVLTRFLQFVGQVMIDKKYNFSTPDLAKGKVESHLLADETHWALNIPDVHALRSTRAAA
jgi:hypothetical protein